MYQKVSSVSRGMKCIKCVSSTSCVLGVSGVLDVSSVLGVCTFFACSILNCGLQVVFFLQILQN